MFSSKNEVYIDLSAELREIEDWKVGILRPIEYLLDGTSLAIDPLAGLTAVGTASGVIHVLGGPGVICRLSLPEPLRVNFLHFAVSVSKLICVDSKDQLHVWDLTAPAQPKHQKSTRFDSPVNSLTLSASHTHAFIALQSGEIRTYDLICLRKSPYTIPNMWSLYEEEMAPTGMSEATSPGSQVPTDIANHPRDLNLVFVVYGGGAILSDLAQRNTLRAYELLIPAGAPGGSGYGSPDLLTHRRPPTTCIAIHPAGHFFAVGHADGTIAFWAIEDEDHPLFVRTLDDLEEVNVVDGNKIEQYLPSGSAPQQNHPPPANREPIFKLSWSSFPDSDPRGGATALIVLGGLLPGDTPGVSVLWLPPFNPPEPPTPSSTNAPKSIHPFIRKAMRESIIPSKSYFYATTGPAQDFLLIPRNSPHFSGAFDPVAILLLSDASGGTRALEALQFPPPEFLEGPSDTPANEADVPEALDALSEDLSSTLQAMSMTDDPKVLQLPSSLWSGKNGISFGEIIKLDRDAYETFTSEISSGEHWLPLEGGTAWTNQAKANEAVLSKYQPHRMLITQHHDFTVQFQDISAQLMLSSSGLLEHHFPNPMLAFTIDLGSLLTDGSVVMRKPPSYSAKASIGSVHLAMESLECAVILKSGDLILYRLGAAAQTLDSIFREAEDKELIVLEHVPRLSGRKYHPYFMLTPGLGAITACDLSDIGFLAVAYADSSLLIMDMRGPKIIFRTDPRSKHKHLPLLRKHYEGDIITCLNWTVCGLSTDAQLRVRLIASRESGRAQIFNMTRPSNSSSWSVDDSGIEAETVSHPLRSFVIDAKTGTWIKADRSRLAASSQPSNSGPCVWVTAGVKGARCVAGVDGERVGKAEWSSKVGAVESVQIVEKNGSSVLVAFTDKNEALVYSLPHLEALQTLHLPESDIAFSVDSTGDFITSSRDPKSSLLRSLTLCTLFDIRRGAYALPDVDLVSRRQEVSIPAQPKPVSAGPPGLLGGAWSWFAGGGRMTGDQIDALLAGPDRPIPLPPKVQPVASSAAARGPVSQAAKVGAEGSSTSRLYERLSSALNERGQALGDLEDRFNSLQDGSKSMVNQAKRLAAEQSAKSWFKF